MLVCRRWRGIMLSTPGIYFGLKIKRSTQVKDIEALVQGRPRLDVIVDMDDEKYEFDPDSFHASFMGAAQAASRWRSLTLVSFPPPGEYEDLRIVQPLQHLESLNLAQGCNLGTFLLPLMTAITTTVTPLLTFMEIANPDAALYLVQPAHFHIFSSLTSLVLLCKSMKDPVDILPHIKRLEIFRAHHLRLPNYPLGADLPLILTLRELDLKVVSVQWMAGHIFPTLKSCSITFPPHVDTIAFQPVTMPSCSTFIYDSNNLRPLVHFSLPVLHRLDVVCGQCTNWRGNLQLSMMQPIFTASAQSLTSLRLQVKCSERFLANMLRLIPALGDLWLGLTSPHALSESFFLEFAERPNVNAMTGPSSQTIAPLCRELFKLCLHYKRWLRCPEKKALIPTFGDIVVSRSLAPLKLLLSFGEWYNLRVWRVCEPVEYFRDILEGGGGDQSYIGFSSPYGIVPLSSYEEPDHLDFLHFKELEYMGCSKGCDIFINNFFFCHSLRELRIPYSVLDIESGTHLPSSLPLKVLEVKKISYSLSAGQTFHRLERFEEHQGDNEHYLRLGLLTEMPLCTQLVVKLSRLAILKLPQIRELNIQFDERDYEPNRTWEKHIMVNANLSGLKLLCLYGHDQPPAKVDLIQILRVLPALETLIIAKHYIVISLMDFFEAFVPIDARVVSSCNEEDQILGVLCPRLETLHIDHLDPGEKPDLIPVLESVVASRAAIGFPLESFAFHMFNPHVLWELIGREGSFIVEKSCFD